jgi:hypothetical protein
LATDFVHSDDWNENAPSLGNQEVFIRFTGGEQWNLGRVYRRSLTELYLLFLTLIKP